MTPNFWTAGVCINDPLPWHAVVTCVHAVQVVKLLIQYGSNPTDKNLAGLSALDMAEKDDMRELLSLPASSVADGQPCEARHRPPGELPLTFQTNVSRAFHFDIQDIWFAVNAFSTLYIYTVYNAYTPGAFLGTDWFSTAFQIWFSYWKCYTTYMMALIIYLVGQYLTV